ncbi:tRNA_anti domain-containing protein [Cephalotus follicularis]|uniref:CST complex subunit STN1 n=1 Tax=Cephalotus follicularis TaxID=3775 RepID=A0A1Q3CDR7_CEPFO|nr:tRNA_anti domain-containing protein [Cephalotus follicularis]
MDQSLHNTHVKLMAFDFLRLSQDPSPSSSDPTTFSRKGVPVSRAEILGLVTFRELKPSKFLKFTLDDGTGCIVCLLWLNQLNSPYFSRRNPETVRLIASMATHFASEIVIGAAARVRGRITSYRGALQITVSDVLIERDPNVEILHWLDCIRLARKRYDVIGKGSVLGFVGFFNS